MIADAKYTDLRVTLEAGDRVLFYSDGIAECTNARGEMLDLAGLRELVVDLQDQRGSAFLDTLLWDLTTYADDRDFSDDVSGLLVEFDPKKVGKGGTVSFVPK